MPRKPLVAFRYSTSDPRWPAFRRSIESQRHAIARFARDERFEVVAEYTDASHVSTSIQPLPPRLVAAINDAKARGCPIVVRAIDDLPRAVSGELTLLVRTGLTFIVAEPGHGAGPFVLRPYAGDRAARADRAREALAAARERGVRLGAPDPSVGARAGARAASEAAERFAAGVLPVIREVEERGETSLRGIARALDARGVPTARGGKWTGGQVAAVLARAPEEEGDAG